MYKLINNVTLPEVGVGTDKLTGKLSSQEAEDLLFNFLTKNDGLSLIDTAPTYGTEELIGRAVNRALSEGVPREKILIETKVPSDMQGYRQTLQTFDESLNRLGVDFIDVYLIHWPIPRLREADYGELNRETWRAMERLYKDGKIRAIGVSNFQPRHLENIMSVAQIQPMINQIEIHFWYQQLETVAWCQARNILVEAWEPFRKGRLFESEDVRQLAEKYNTTADKIALTWLNQRLIMPLVKSSSLERMLGNLQIPDIEFSREDSEFISSLDDENGHENFYNYRRLFRY